MEKIDERDAVGNIESANSVPVWGLVTRRGRLVAKCYALRWMASIAKKDGQKVVRCELRRTK